MIVFNAVYWGRVPTVNYNKVFIHLKLAMEDRFYLDTEFTNGNYNQGDILELALITEKRTVYFTNIYKYLMIFPPM